MATASQTATGAASFQGLTDKLACIIYLLNTTNMTATQIATGADAFQGMTDKLSAIIYLLASGSGGGVSSGTATPSSTPTAGLLYFKTSDKTLWAADGSGWNQLV